MLTLAEVLRRMDEEERARIAIRSREIFHEQFATRAAAYRASKRKPL